MARLWMTQLGTPSSQIQPLPRFPDGLTVLDAYGQWRNLEGVVEKERSKVLVVLAPPGEEPLSLIHEVSDEYKRRFDQDAVIQATSAACVAFR